jgi:NAD-dependent dihydropyrimidine dehydrogenase PreA subunit
MPKPVACVDARRCDPQGCDGGTCAALRLCQRRVLKQEASGEVPFISNSELCRGCFLCLPACPQAAIVKCQ